MLLEMLATTENMFMEVARNVICAIETAAESAEVGHLMDCPGPIGEHGKKSPKFKNQRRRLRVNNATIIYSRFEQLRQSRA